MKRRSIMIASLTFSLAALGGVSCGGTDNGGGGDVCAQITGYTATVAGPLSFATDVYPILADTNVTNGCGQTAICHGNPPGGLDDLFVPTKFLQFVYNPVDIATAKAQLMMASVNAPTMQRVVPSNVGQSFMAYKIWDAERKGLACVANSCVAGASIGDSMPCGDEMPSVGTIDPAARTKILDWIALGAAD